MPTPDDAAALRAERAADARAALAAATHRAEGTAVRGYRSRKGRIWAGWSPVSSAAPEQRRTHRVRQSLGLAAPASLADVRSWQAFDPTTARVAVRLVNADRRLRDAQRVRLLASIDARTLTLWEPCA